ncbi:hypothetical protein LINPERHAP2_LOCUS20992, partial [Linum perenne]
RVCLAVWFGGEGWRFRDSAISHSLELRLTHRQNCWNQDDETDVLGQNSGAAFRLSFPFRFAWLERGSKDQEFP